MKLNNKKYIGVIFNKVNCIIQFKYFDTWTKENLMNNFLSRKYYDNIETFLQSKFWYFNYENCIFFDAGTFFKSAEVSVRDYQGKSLLYNLFNIEQLNIRGNLILDSDKTNNYCELFSCYLALQIAKKLNINYIAGDAKIIIFDILENNKKTKIDIELTEKVRMFYKQNNINIQYINRNINPADLRFKPKEN